MQQNAADFTKLYVGFYGLKSLMFLRSYFTIDDVIQNTPFSKRPFAFLPGLIGPTYDGVGLGWVLDDGLSGGHDDLAWPIKAAYFVLPFLLASSMQLTRVVDPKKKDDEGELKYLYSFNPVSMAFNMSFPAGL